MKILQQIWGDSIKKAIISVKNMTVVYYGYTIIGLTFIVLRLR